MVDPLLSLAFALHHNPGVYALLIGSGVSRAAEIPTGWEVVLDLIEKLAHLEGADDGASDPEAWYRAKFDKDPDYSELLDAIAHSQAERSQLLRQYFEPSEAEREEGSKTPTAAHRAIADLVAQGVIKVIVTTNFDRLIEQAIEEAGVTPSVIASADAADGAMPLAHSPCTVIKLHGDYLDTRIKNTPEELDEYDERMDTLLDRVLDEYGLVICGWSGEWDRALIRGIERCRSRRFSTYWAAYGGNVSERAERLIQLRRAEVVPIDGADGFFSGLNEKVRALGEFDRPHPLSPKLAISSLKRYIADERHRIALHDLVDTETEQLVKGLSQERFSAAPKPTTEEFHKRLEMYEAEVGVVQGLLAHGSYWGKSEHRYLWPRVIERVANATRSFNGYDLWLQLRQYPALIMQYVGGIGAVAGAQYETLYAMLSEPALKQLNGTMSPLLALKPTAVIDGEVQKLLPKTGRHFAPLSSHLFDVLREPLRGLVPDDDEYGRVFERFEYVAALLYVDATLKDLEHREYAWAPIGRFIREFRVHYQEAPDVSRWVTRESEEGGAMARLVSAGAFNGDRERLRAVHESSDEFFRRAAFRM